MAVYRAYDPDLGRWLSRDPQENAEIGQGVNLFAYVNNSPVNLTDLFGLQDSAPTPGPSPQAHASPTSPAPSPSGGLLLSAAGRGLLSSLGYVVPGSELLDAAKLGPTIGKIAVLTAFEKACRDCFIKACTDSPDLKCEVCNDYEKLKKAFGP